MSGSCVSWGFPVALALLRLEEEDVAVVFDSWLVPRFLVAGVVDDELGVWVADDDSCRRVRGVWVGGSLLDPTTLQKYPL